MLITKTVKVKVYSANIKHYQEKGYDVKYGDEIEVKTEDLPENSHIWIEASCDYCGKTINKKLQTYNNSRKLLAKDCCDECKYIKREEIVKLVRNGVAPNQTKEVKERRKETNKNKYGVENVFQAKEIKEKIVQSNLNRHGVEYPMQSKEILEKSRQSCFEHYGVENPAQSKEIQEKTKKTNLERYGSEYTLSNKGIWQKAHDKKSGKAIATSSQQSYLHELYGGELNAPLGYFYVDILFKRQKVGFEYDGTGHDLAVRTGRETKEHFERREIIKYKQLLKAGYKQFKIINEKADILPSDEILLNMKRIAFYFLNHTDYNYIWFYPEKNLIKIHGKDIEWDFKTKLKRNFYLD